VVALQFFEEPLPSVPFEGPINNSEVWSMVSWFDPSLKSFLWFEIVFDESFSRNIAALDRRKRNPLSKEKEIEESPDPDLNKNLCIINWDHPMLSTEYNLLATIGLWEKFPGIAFEFILKKINGFQAIILFSD
jgi:hypothetical protein